MTRSTRRVQVAPSSGALVLAALAVAGLVVFAARLLARSRRRSRRRTLLALPDDALDEAASLPAGAEATDPLDDLRDHPRPIGADEAARLLGLEAGDLAALNIPVTPAPDGSVVYDSWEIVHWEEQRRADPATFAARVGAR
ncbi:MAG TPA: hypothetical protein VFM14_13430 [Gemmatimonadales bacterium]|nr:hypothetical protein [Gemmatimonadales bacterium]